MAINFSKQYIEIEVDGVKFVFDEPRGNDDTTHMSDRFMDYMLGKLLRIEGEILEDGRAITVEDIKAKNVPARFFPEVVAKLVQPFSQRIIELLGVKRSEEKNEAPSA
jgi:acyl-coenzyme A thioesterase PaaI-like protein